MSDAEKIFNAIQHLDDRVTELHGEVQSRTSNPLSDEELMWVRLAIQREAQSIKLRQAVIEKTLAGLVWAGLAGLGLMILEAWRHGGKP